MVDPLLVEWIREKYQLLSETLTEHSRRRWAAVEARSLGCHFPPGTSKWNKIEHRLFCHVTRNWQGKPLESYEIIVNLIGSTQTASGLKVYAKLDPNRYEKGREVTDDELATVNLQPAKFHGEWNYTIKPNG